MHLGTRNLHADGDVADGGLRWPHGFPRVADPSVCQAPSQSRPTVHHASHTTHPTGQDGNVWRRRSRGGTPSHVTTFCMSPHFRSPWSHCHRRVCGQAGVLFGVPKRLWGIAGDGVGNIDEFGSALGKALMNDCFMAFEKWPPIQQERFLRTLSTLNPLATSPKVRHMVGYI